jgi:uncharacterized membrane protein YfcA
MFEFSLIAIAAFFAGVLNAMAGGGSFLTFPALIYIGIPPIAANATSALAVFPGYLSSTFGFMQEIRAFDRKQLLQLLALSCVGGLAGAMLLLTTPSEIFRGLIPWLLLFATFLFAMGDRISAYLNHSSEPCEKSSPLAVLVVSVYGGYFNGGLGIILLALFSSMGFRDLNLMNGLKNVLSFLLSAVSVTAFAVAGIVHWPEAMMMMVTASIGGYVGARLARKLPAKQVKHFVVLVGLLMSIAFFVL